MQKGAKNIFLRPMILKMFFDIAKQMIGICHTKAKGKIILLLITKKPLGRIVFVRRMEFNQYA